MEKSSKYSIQELKLSEERFSKEAHRVIRSNSQKEKKQDHSPFNDLNILRKTINAIPIGCMILSFEDLNDLHSIRIHLVNKASEQANGVKPEDVEGMLMKDAYAAIYDTLDEVVLAYRDEVVQKGKSVDFGAVVYGDEKVQKSTFKLSAHPIEGPYFFILYQNITAQEEAKNQILSAKEAIQDQNNLLSQTAQTLDLALESGKIGVWNWHVNTGALHWDRRMNSLFGIQHEVTKYEDFRNAVHPDDIERIEQALEQCLKGKGAYDVTYRIFLPSGEMKHIAATGAVQKDEKGVNQYFIGTCRDVSESIENNLKLKQLNTELLQQKNEIEKTSRTLLFTIKSGRYGVWSWDFSTNKLTWDDRMFEFYGVEPKDELMFGDMLKYIHPEDIDKVQETIQATIEQKGEAAIDYRIVLDNGEIKHIRTSGGAKLNDDGEIESYHGVCHEITDIVLKEEQLQELNAGLEKEVKRRTLELEKEIQRSKELNKELENFSFTVSHDLRAPLRILKGFSNKLIDRNHDKLDDRSKKWLQFIATNAEKMDGLIMAILESSRLSRMDLSKNLLETDSMVKHNFKMVSHHYELPINLSLQEDIPNVYADRQLINLVWQNLIENALKYSSKCEEVHVEIKGWEDDHMTYFSIEDNGAGFDQRHAENLFEMFKRLHTNDEFNGTGVGLASVKKILMAHGGNIIGKGEVNKGARFEFWVPKYQQS